jgi:hypothetical protein
MAKSSLSWQFVAIGLCQESFVNKIHYGIEEAATEAEAIGIATLNFKKLNGFSPSTVDVSKIDLEQMMRSWMKTLRFEGLTQADFAGTSKNCMGYQNVNDRHMVYCLVQGDMDELLPRISKAVPEIVKGQSFVMHSRVEQIISMVLGAFPSVPQWKKGDR